MNSTELIEKLLQNPNTDVRIVVPIEGGSISAIVVEPVYVKYSEVIDVIEIRTEGFGYGPEIQ